MEPETCASTSAAWPLTYGPNRRIGALGAHVMVVDIANKTTRPVGEWRELR